MMKGDIFALKYSGIAPLVHENKVELI